MLENDLWRIIVDQNRQFWSNLLKDNFVWNYEYNNESIFALIALSWFIMYM